MLNGIILQISQSTGSIADSAATASTTVPTLPTPSQSISLWEMAEKAARS